MYTYKYERAALATDAVVFGFDGSKLNVLLIERGLDPYKGQWAFPGGFLKMDETVEEGCRRELREETNVKDVHLDQLHCFSSVNRDPRERIVTMAFIAFVRQGDYEVMAGDDAAKAKWFAVDDIPTLAFDHQEILRVALDKLRWKITYEPVAFHLLNKRFTMTQLQSIYECVMGVKYDRRNFHKKMMSLGYIVPLQIQETSNGRPATLFMFDEEAYKVQIEKRSAI